MSLKKRVFGRISCAAQRRIARSSAVGVESLETRQLLSAAVGTAHRNVSVAPAATSAVYGYTPAQIRHAYGFDQVSGTGANQTIAIVDAYNDPNITSDLHVFDQKFGLADPPSFKVVNQNGGSASSVQTDSGWAGEIALDVEWAHAIAPGASIDLVLAPTGNDLDLYNALKYAANLTGVRAVSMSFAEAESCMDPTLMSEQSALFASASAKGITFVAASGDQGAAQSCDGIHNFKAVSTPASDPNVTAVGGTILKADLSTGRYISEETWNEVAQYNVASGGGFSSLYSLPSYQRGTVSGSARGLPDVSYSASNAWGDYVYWASSNQGFHNWTFAGTSVGTPQWAALVDLASQQAGHGLGNVNPKLYSLSASDFNDMVSGNNTFGKIEGYNATKGWDAATGLGSPDAAAVVNGLAKK